MKKFAIVLVALALAGCTKTTQEYVYVKYEVPKQILVCPQLKATDIPDPSTLTDEQISKLIGKMFNYIQTCGMNNSAVKEFIEKVNKLADERNKRKK